MERTVLDSEQRLLLTQGSIRAASLHQKRRAPPRAALLRALRAHLLFSTYQAPVVAVLFIVVAPLRKSRLPSRPPKSSSYRQGLSTDLTES